MSELFEDGKPYLILYHLMYWANDDSFCPMCSLWIDGFNGITPHVTQRANFVIASRAIDAEDADGNPDSTIVVFAKDGDEVRHVYTAHPMLQDRERGIDLLCPVWHLFDLMPSGRGDWYGSNDAFDASLRTLAGKA